MEDRISQSYRIMSSGLRLAALKEGINPDNRAKNKAKARIIITSPKEMTGLISSK